MYDEKNNDFEGLFLQSLGLENEIIDLKNQINESSKETQIKP